MKTILWDFDGVILDSMSVRDEGFEAIFKQFKPSEVEALLAYHRHNGGLSRYVKIKYFFNTILNSEITDDEVNAYASEFSKIMRTKLTEQNNLIQDAVRFIKKEHEHYNFHIVSGSDQEELRFLCKALLIDQYFITINGSPVPKNKLVKNILQDYNYMKEKVCLIGDSINDLDASVANDISFFAYNNQNLKSLNVNYIESFKDFSFN